MKRGARWPRKHIRSCVFYWYSDSPILISTQCSQMLIGSILGTRAPYGMTTESLLRSLETSQSAFPAVSPPSTAKIASRGKRAPPNPFTVPSNGVNSLCPSRVFSPLPAHLALSYVLAQVRHDTVERPANSFRISSSDGKVCTTFGIGLKPFWNI